MVVTGNPDEPVRESSVATKIETPLIETPRSITTIDRRTLDDLGVINITQAHDYAVGLTLLDERGPGFARGFPVEFYDLRRDGLRTYAWSVREPVALDRIQYLRGPDGVLYGDGSPGALVNMVLKKPLPTPRYEVASAREARGSAGSPRISRGRSPTIGVFAIESSTLGLVAQNLTNRHYATSGAGATFIAAPLRRVALQLTTVF